MNFRYIKGVYTKSCRFKRKDDPAKRIYARSICAVMMSLITLCASIINIHAEALSSECVLGVSSVSADSAVLIEAESGRILYEKNAYQKRSMASTTKIMTGLLAIENYDLQSVVTVARDAVGVEGSSIYLQEDEKLRMEELVYALMLESTNDAAAAIAIAVGGSIEQFASMMNEKASDIGLENTSFSNPHGLDAEGHYTTAYDLARLAAYALENESFKKIVSTHRRVLKTDSGDVTRLLVNHNRLLNSYSGIIGVKTGYTRKSGRCLVSAAERDGVRLIAVTLNAPDDWNDHRQMLDYGFDICERNVLAEDGSINICVPVTGGEKDLVECKNASSASVVMLKGHGEITNKIELSRFYYAPIEEGERLGRVVWYCDGKEIASSDMIAADSVKQKYVKLTFGECIKKLFGLPIM